MNGDESMGSRFVRPETTVLRISNGDILTVKRRLTAGEHRQMIANMSKHGPEGSPVIDPVKVHLAKVLAYLVDWSLSDDDGRVVPIRHQPTDVVEAALDALDPDSFIEIRDAIDAHTTAMSQEKKLQVGESGSSLTSTLPADVGGAMSGSLNSTQMCTTS